MTGFLCRLFVVFLLVFHAFSANAKPGDDEAWEVVQNFHRAKQAGNVDKMKSLLNLEPLRALGFNEKALDDYLAGKDIGGGACPYAWFTLDKNCKHLRTDFADDATAIVELDAEIRDNHVTCRVLLRKFSNGWLIQPLVENTLVSMLPDHRKEPLPYGNLIYGLEGEQAWKIAESAGSCVVAEESKERQYTAVVEALKALCARQMEFKKKKLLDVDKDKVAEYGMLFDGINSLDAPNDLVDMQHSAMQEEANMLGVMPLGENYYVFCALPSRCGLSVNEDEHGFCIVAWPKQAMGLKAFFVTETGHVYQNDNKDNLVALGYLNPLTVAECYATPFDNNTIDKTQWKVVAE